ncbi:MAG TPA: DEAD/DEAH box helicase [Anaerolineaceae bacterium]|nr:DEAD/DEAH box helicase [Anaerolineaceae bacterium]
MSVTNTSSLSHLLEIWRNDASIARNIVAWQVIPEKPARLEPIPANLHPNLTAALRHQGFDSLYSHQAASLRAALAGENLVVVTETASGKTLSYNLPVIDSLLRDPAARALYIFPTKALTYDQHQVLEKFLRISAGQEGKLSAAVYDGDTPAYQRSSIRGRASILLTNPDMLHTGILPHHTIWADFLRGIRYVVIDEIHTYRGVFGSHVANVLRRLKRILAFYGARPQFILTSATIANPREHAERLVEAPVTVIDQDGAPHGERNFLLYNPPVLDPDTGIRRSSSAESTRLASDLLDYHVQTILFGRARRTVELLLKSLRHAQPDKAGAMHAYRSGYLPGERRGIESGLRSGDIRAVVATSALELGIDIGSMDAALMVGYPGTIAGTRQQAGRAGRRLGVSLAMLVASASPLDQYLMRHPDYIFHRSPEHARINADNPLILLQHLRCAAFEMAFQPGERFGSLDPETLQAYLAFMAVNGELHLSGDRFFWMADAYPASEISLRSASAQPVVLQAEIEDRLVTIGMVDPPSAPWMVHPQAIYLHEGQSFQVESLDLENRLARLVPVETDYYTEPQREMSIEKINVTREETAPGGNKALGEILVTTQVTGFRRTRWFSQENLGAGQVDLPPSQLRTTGFWISIASQAVDTLRELNLWKNDTNDYGPNWIVQRNRARERDHFTCQVCGAQEAGRSHHVHHKTPFRNFPSYLAANQLDNLITVCPSCHRRVETAVRMRSGLAGLSYVLANLAPLFLMCDSEDLGNYAEPESALGDGQPTVAIFDKAPAGIGLSEALYGMSPDLLSQAEDLVRGCECKDGCPSCVGPAGENGVGGKEETLALLSLLNGKIPTAKENRGISLG